jgi:hypothetical protein
MITGSQVIDLFGETGPSGPSGRPRYVGGEPADAMVYYPGGYGSLREVSRMIQEAGPSGLAQAGGSRSRQQLRKTRSSRQRSRKNNKKNRRSRNRR